MKVSDLCIGYLCGMLIQLSIFNPIFHPTRYAEGFRAGQEACYSQFHVAPPGQEIP